MKICTLLNCDKKHEARGYCNGHYKRWKNGLSLSSPIESRSGATKLPEYVTWSTMKQRCYDVKCKSYARYGAKGTTVCKRWRYSFENFLADMGTKPTPQHSIDRIDNSKGYEPNNCRWADRLTQSNNRSVVNKVLYRGQKRTLREISNMTGIPHGTLAYRFYKQLPLDAPINSLHSHIAWNKNKTFVDKLKVCEMCNKQFECVKSKQKFCGHNCVVKYAVQCRLAKAEAGVLMKGGEV